MSDEPMLAFTVSVSLLASPIVVLPLAAMLPEKTEVAVVEVAST